nr:helix-turn-helix domain-containing protein [Kibdelosporangium sp. MJ126-NF4]CEL21473.1 Regulator of polyketide synthase expression-like [Kibdelosporangium sp. MJ126-NF4]CTQ95960.1 Regulator of polyketide synthase expression-like [Kibdelosporangium sp. MJ126-NF4]
MSHVPLRDLLAGPDLNMLTVLTAAPQRSVSSVRVIDKLTDLRAVPRDSFVVVLASASAQARGHLFDIAMRDAMASGVGAIVLNGIDATAVESTAVRIANRHAMSLLLAPASLEPTRLVVTVSEALAGDATAALARIDAARRLIASAETRTHDRKASILLAASDALGVPVTARQPTHGEPAAPVLVDGSVDTFVATEVSPDARGAWVVAARAVATLTADAYARVIADERRTELAPLADRGRLLGELLLAPDSERVQLVSHARTVGLPVDGWHQVLRFELSSSLDAGTAISADQVDAISVAMLHAVRAEIDAKWHSTRIGGEPLLVHSVDTDPGPAAGRIARAAATTALGAARKRFPGIVVRCGIGAVHRQAEGLRTSATDAKAALAVTRQAKPQRDVVAIDALGLNRMLVEWYASDNTRASVDDLLAPLVDLGPTASEEAIRTLQAYLDHQNSPARAAEVLRVHRQTVHYRLNKITRQLGVDLADPEQRLALQLACRAWLMR